MSDDQVRAAISSVLYKAINELRTLADSVREDPKAGVQARSASAFYIEHGARRLTAPPQQDPRVSASHTEKMVDPYKVPTPEWRRWDSDLARASVEGVVLRLEEERDEAIRQRDEAWQRIAELDP